LPCESHAKTEDDDFLAVSIEQGERAPFSGQLYSTELAIELSQGADSVKRKIQAEKNKCREAKEVEIVHSKEIFDIQIDAGKLRERALERSLKDALDYHTAWYKSPEIIALTTFGVTLLLVEVAKGN